MDPLVSESPEREFQLLYERFYSEVRAFCARRVGRAEAEDVAAEVFVTAWRRLEMIDGTSERAWLFGIARNLILNQWRSASRRNRLTTRIGHLRPPEPDQPEAVFVEGETGPRIGLTSPAYSHLMRIKVITMFPGYFSGPLETSIVGRAIADGHLSVEIIDLRVYGIGKHRQLDDAPFGGGPGMVMMIEPLAAALEPLERSHKVYFTPAGRPLDQDTLDRWATLDELSLLCGRFEGVDQRVIDQFIDEEVSLGDYVLAGGEVAAAAAVEGVARLIPGVIGNPESAGLESFRDGLLEEPVYTRPAEFRGWSVPEVLLSGDHGKIEEWRRAKREERTRQRRPDLTSNGTDSDT